MLNITMMQALELWTKLEDARHGVNSYGGHEAEIYIYTVLPYTPALQQQNQDMEGNNFFAERLREVYDQANESLYELLQLFSNRHEVPIEVEGQPLGPWLKTARYVHRVHVHVKSEKKEYLTHPTLLGKVEPMPAGNLHQFLSDRINEKRIPRLSKVTFKVAEGVVEAHALVETEKKR